MFTVLNLSLVAARCCPLMRRYLPSSMSAWQLPRQFAIVLRCGWKERALVEAKSDCLIGQGSGLTRLVFRASGGQVRFGM